VGAIGAPQALACRAPTLSSPPPPRQGDPLARSTRPWSLVLLLAAALACAGGSGRPQSADERTEEEALAEASALCDAHVDLGPGDEEAQRRRLRVATWQLSSGGLSLDDAMDELARAHHEARADCLDQVLPALAGDGGVAAVAILRAARVSCEADAALASPAALRECIHRRKLEIFAARNPSDGPRERETLDRLLRVGGGAPLPPALRGEYCRTRELTGTRHPLCE